MTEVPAAEAEVDIAQSTDDSASWLPMTANAFPYPMRDVLVAAFDSANEKRVLVFRCRCAEHGAYFEKEGGTLSLVEDDWVPFALRADDLPERDDPRFPPMRKDYVGETVVQPPPQPGDER